MMTEWDCEKFMLEAVKLTAEVHAREGDLRAVLAPHFQRALREHPDEERRLHEWWDKLTARQVV